MSNIKQCIDDFLLSKEIEDGCSPNTIKAYRHDLTMFLDSLSPNINIEQLNQLHIRRFLKILKDKDYTKVGLARKIACLKSYFGFLERNEIIAKNPMKLMHSPRIRQEEHLPKFLSLDETVKLMEFIKNGKGIPYTTRKRIYIVIRLLYATMARVSEIQNAKIGDIDFTRGVIHLRGKGNKERIVPIDDETCRILREYILERISFNSSDPLLINKFGEGLSVRVIQRDIQIVKQKFGLEKDKKLTPHIFRHTGATHLRQNGMDISELQDILGHSSPNTTRIYAKNDITGIRSEYLKRHPLTKKITKEY